VHPENSPVSPEFLFGHTEGPFVSVLSGPGREGLALLQGLLLCGRCGRALTVRYTGNGGINTTYLCNRLRREGLATNDCRSVQSAVGCAVRL
jgi:hypothetical protein